MGATLLASMPSKHAWLHPGLPPPPPGKPAWVWGQARVSTHGLTCKTMCACMHRTHNELIGVMPCSAYSLPTMHSA